jgi:hypothetical protein
MQAERIIPPLDRAYSPAGQLVGFGDAALGTAWVLSHVTGVGEAVDLSVGGAAGRTVVRHEVANRVLK